GHPRPNQRTDAAHLFPGCRGAGRRPGTGGAHRPDRRLRPRRRDGRAPDRSSAPADDRRRHGPRRDRGDPRRRRRARPGRHPAARGWHPGRRHGRPRHGGDGGGAGDEPGLHGLRSVPGRHHPGRGRPAHPDRRARSGRDRGRRRLLHRPPARQGGHGPPRPAVRARSLPRRRAEPGRPVADAGPGPVPARHLRAGVLCPADLQQGVRRVLPGGAGQAPERPGAGHPRELRRRRAAGPAVARVPGSDVEHRPRDGRRRQRGRRRLLHAAPELDDGRLLLRPGPGRQPGHGRLEADRLPRRAHQLLQRDREAQPAVPGRVHQPGAVPRAGGGGNL
ncbi:MAG: Gluconate 2-dehydrogenase, membrane-bound, gamma subunit, partial [uncultured Thermomicrobiales bacterium]